MNTTGEQPSVFAGNPRKPGKDNLPWIGKLKKMTETARTNVNQIVQALVITAITSIGVYVLAVAKLEVKLEAVQGNLQEIKTQLQEMRRDFYIPAHSSPGPAPRPNQDGK